MTYLLAGSKAHIYGRAPLNGEDSVAILEQLGYGKDAIDALIKDGSVIANKA